MFRLSGWNRQGGVLTRFPCSRNGSTLRALNKGVTLRDEPSHLRPCWTTVFEQPRCLRHPMGLLAFLPFKKIIIQHSATLTLTRKNNRPLLSIPAVSGGYPSCWNANKRFLPKASRNDHIKEGVRFLLKIQPFSLNSRASASVNTAFLWVGERMPNQIPQESSAKVAILLCPMLPYTEWPPARACLSSDCQSPLQAIPP